MPRGRIGLVTASPKKVPGAKLGFSGDTRDGLGGGGWNVFSAGWTIGSLDIESPIERAADALTARSQGGYHKLQLSAARLQTLSGPLSLYAAVRGQLAFDNLDSSEKMELGGAYGVRAYPEGESYGDQGYIATAEARLMRAMGRQAYGKAADDHLRERRSELRPRSWFAGSNSEAQPTAGLVGPPPRSGVRRPKPQARRRSGEVRARKDGRFCSGHQLSERRR